MLDFDKLGTYEEPNTKTPIPVSKWHEIVKDYVPHDNAQITQIYKDEKGNLNINFALIDENKNITNESNIRLIKEYVLDNLDLEKNTKDVITLLNDCLNLHAQLAHIAAVYVTSDKLQKCDLFKGTNITSNDNIQNLSNRDTLDKVYANIVNWFLATLKPVKLDSKTLMVKFFRQSATKPYISLPPYRKMTATMSSPILEPFIADIEDKQLCSKIKYSAYDRGYRKGTEAPIGLDRANPNEITPTAQTPVLTQKQAEENAATLRELFGADN